uniref:Prefoldin subunit 3 n=1 Tax=Steinernema glaseri TaxID=37863 RepID=A0A1I8A4C5_9BILA
MSELKTEKKKTAEQRVNDMNVPQIVALENVEEYVKECENYSKASAKVENDYRTTKMVQSNLMSVRERIIQNLPDLQNNLKMLEVLKERQDNDKPFSTSFLLSDQVYTDAHVEKVENVYLWLGAGVMAEFPIDKATAFIKGKISELNTKATDLAEELEIVKQRLTTCEVNMANIYNFGVRMRQQLPVQAK